MPSFCNYRNCHNLASSTYLGYCNEYHMKRAKEIEPLEKILEEHPEVKSLAEAKVFLQTKREESKPHKKSQSETNQSESKSS